MKAYLKIFLGTVISILVSTIIFSIINKFEIKILPFFYLIFAITIMFITGYLFGHKIKDKGLPKGALLGLGVSILMFILSILIGAKLSIYMLIYYSIITLSIAFGSMIGINKKER